jgi:transcription initiation factor TFIIH subunit 1
MDMPPVTVRAKLLANPKDAGIPGVLMINVQGLKWTPNDPTSGVPLDVKASNITMHQCSKEVPGQRALMKVATDVEGKSYLFNFQNYDERAPARDAVSNVLARNKAGASAPAVASASGTAKPTHGGDQLDPVEMSRRMKLLQQDPDLLKLHQQLVGGNVLTEVEFWATRKNLLEDEQGGVQKQRTGLRSAMLADVRPLTDGRSNKVTFNLTPEIIHQIFAEKPAVHRAFLMSVPSKMSESAFWTKYCRAEYLYRTKNNAAAAAEAAEDEDLAVFTRDDDIIAESARHKIQRVDPTLDMAADLNDDYLSLPGHGVLRDGAKESVEMVEGGARKRTIIHDINRHAAVVLEGSPLDAELKDTTTVAHALARALQKDIANEAADRGAEKRRTERISIMTEMEDLEGPPPSSFVPLTIQDPRNYFDSQQSAGTATGLDSTPVNPAVVLSAFKAQLKNFQTKREREPVIAPELAFKILTDMTQHMASSRHTTGTAAERNILESLPRATRDELLQHSNTANELLRHFWAAYPLTNKALTEKATRLKDAMAQLYNQIQKMKESASPDARHQLSRLLQPMIQTLDAAFTQFDGEAAKKAEAAKRARIAARPNLNIALDVIS